MSSHEDATGAGDGPRRRVHAGSPPDEAPRAALAAGPDTLPLSRGSVSWRVNGDPAPFFGASAALLLQVAHPLVAAGVDQHSDYASDPRARLYRTLATTLKLAFGAPPTVRRMERRLAARHAPVVGVTRDGRPYDARDPQLGLWVWATLVHTGLAAHERAYGPLSDRDREGFYQESKRFARASGVPRETCPATWQDFLAYYDRVIEEELERTPECLGVARSAFRAPHLPAGLRRPAGRLAQFTAAGFLPERVRGIYGLNWSERRERRFQRLLRGYGAVMRRVPRPLRELPAVLVVDHDLLERLERRRRGRRARARRAPRGTAV